MPSRDFSGKDVYKVLINAGNFAHIRTNGDHAILRWNPPEHHDTDTRVVSIPLHDRLKTGTLRQIADEAGANDFDAFCRWIDRHS